MLVEDGDGDDALQLQARTMQAVPEPATVSPPRAGCTLPPLTGLDNLMSSEQVAELLGVTAAAVVIWRRRKTGPAYIRAGGRRLYAPADVLAFLNLHRVAPATPLSRINRPRK